MNAASPTGAPRSHNAPVTPTCPPVACLGGARFLAVSGPQSGASKRYAREFSLSYTCVLLPHLAQEPARASISTEICFFVRTYCCECTDSAVNVSPGPFLHSAFGHCILLIPMFGIISMLGTPAYQRGKQVHSQVVFWIAVRR